MSWTNVRPPFGPNPGKSTERITGKSKRQTNKKASILLDVLTPLSDYRQESVEKMERRILEVSYMYWICTTGFRVVGFLCARLIPVSLFRLPRRGLPHPTALFSGYHAEGYHARTDTFKLTGYHVCRVTTPELPRSIQTSGYRRVITPAGGF